MQTLVGPKGENTQNQKMAATNRNTPKARVELHIHIDGSMRLSTIWELSKEKGLPLPGKGSLQELTDAVVVTEPNGLASFLKGFRWLIPPVQGDVKAIERIAYEFCEDIARAGVLYVEGRYSPHGFATNEVPPEMVVETMNKGLKRGETDFGIKVRSILCCILGQPENCASVVELCDKYRDQGVVAIDIAGDEKLNEEGSDIHIPQDYILAFLEAERRGIHRTMHAGEVGTYAMVDKAVNVLHAERIGHGYHVLDNEELYADLKKKDIHFEMCPHSSLLTGAVTSTTLTHPIVRLAEDKANFSINSDDPSITTTWMPDEYRLIEMWGLTEVHKIRAVFNAARSCFLPAEEKKDLIRQLKEIYGIPE